MEIKFNRSTDVTRVPAQQIPIYHSKSSPLRATLKLVVIVLVAAMLGTVFGLTVTQADTAASIGDMSTVVAQTSSSGSSDRPGPPPREAIAACANQALETACGISGRNGEKILGTCRSPEAGIPAACVPSEMPSKG